MCSGQRALGPRWTAASKSEAQRLPDSHDAPKRRMIRFSEWNTGAAGDRGSTGETDRSLGAVLSSMEFREQS
jgi:hypothetical protein